MIHVECIGEAYQLYAHVQSHRIQKLLYRFHCIPAIYLLLSLGREVNTESVKKLLDSVGLNMSIELVGFAYTFYMDHRDII